MQSIRKPALATLFVAALLTGCGAQSRLGAPDPNASAGSAEQAEISSQLAANPDLIDDAVFEAGGETDLEGAMGAEASIATEGEGSAPAARPLRFWRRITDVRRSFEFAYADTDSAGRPTLAVVTVNKALSGTFNIQKIVRRDSVVERVVLQKPLKDHWMRKLLLKRVRVAESDRPQWRIVGSSGVEVTSRGAATRIQSLRIQAGSFDTTLTDPLALVRLRRVLRVEPGDRVMVTVTTLGVDDVVVSQHRDRRILFHNDGNMTYSAKLPVGMLAGVHHLGVNALSHGTLFDDASPYNSQAWILPYVVRPTELADLGE